MDGLPYNAKKAYKFKNMQEPLVSITVLFDNRYEVTITKNMYRYQNGAVLF